VSRELVSKPGFTHIQSGYYVYAAVLRVKYVNEVPQADRLDVSEAARP
jgi:hypothetical protein